MRKVSIEAESLQVDYGSRLHMDGRYVLLSLTMTERQRREAAIQLLGGMTDADVVALLKSEFLPQLLEATA